MMEDGEERYDIKREKVPKIFIAINIPLSLDYNHHNGN